MINVFSLLISRCGLSQREAANFLAVSINQIKKWSAGTRSPPPGVAVELRALNEKIENAASAFIDQIHALEIVGTAPDVIELGIASDDTEARQPPLNWPCVGAQAAAYGIVIARLDRDFRIVARGSSPATAKAADDHDNSFD